MSLTVIFAAIAPFLLGIAVGSLVAYYDKDKIKNKIYLFVGWIFAGLALASILLSLMNLNNNMQQSQINCMDKGGVIWASKCLDRAPQEIGKL